MALSTLSTLSTRVVSRPWTRVRGTKSARPLDAVSDERGEPFKTDDGVDVGEEEEVTTMPSTRVATRRAAVLTAVLCGVATAGMTRDVEPALASRGGIFDDDDDPFARNDGGRVLDRAASTARRAAEEETEDVVTTTGVEETTTTAPAMETVVETETTTTAAAPTPTPTPARVTQSSTELDTKALLNNQRVRTYNNAPADFPEFVREGYDVRVIHGNDYIVQPNGLIVKDYLPGSGESPKDNQECTFDYVAYNENGGTIDSTYRRGAPATSRIGINGMIPGFELGLKTMRPGGKRRIIVPPELGPPVGPATFFSSKQWEVFDIELKEVKSCSRSSFGMVSSVVCE